MLEKVNASLLDLEQIRCVTLLCLVPLRVVSMPHAHWAIESHVRWVIVSHGRGISSSERRGYGSILSSILLLRVHVQVPTQVLVVLVTWLLSGRRVMWGLSSRCASSPSSATWSGRLHEAGRCSLTAFPRITHFIYEWERALLLLLFTRLLY